MGIKTDKWNYWATFIASLYLMVMKISALKEINTQCRSITVDTHIGNDNFEQDIHKSSLQ